MLSKVLWVGLAIGLLAVSRNGARGQGGVLGEAGLHARLSAADTATEYWEVAAQLRSGHRFWARFLITNEGPGSRTAAAVGHVFLPDGVLLPIKFGRAHDRWRLSSDGRELKVASAVLSLAGPTAFLEIDSDKHDIKLRIQFPREEGMAAFSAAAADEYGIEVQLPVPAQATLWMRGMPERVTSAGTVLLTHTWMERSESDLIDRRVEVFARSDDVAMYLVELTRTGGAPRSWLGVRQGNRMRYRSAAGALRLSAFRSPADDSSYPVAQHWEAHDDATTLLVDLQREWLRWDPLTIVPQPFRALLAWKSQPRRVWADAQIDLKLPAAADQAAVAVQGAGLGSVSFLRAEAAR